MKTEHPPSEVDNMRLALREAARGQATAAPNPPVGCVLVRGGEVVGRGFHVRAGEPHAEVLALRGAGERAHGATAYVTLEPCAHTGRTPPCADALIAAGVARVVVAALDPDPRVAGQGVARLRAAGVDVTLGVLEDEATRQQAGFRMRVTAGRPWVAYKYAMTLDGRVAAEGEGRGAVTSAPAWARVMAWRAEADAVAVGSGTVLADDPRLNVRELEGSRDPRPVVFDRSGRVPPTARALRPGSVLVTAPGADLRPHADQLYAERGVTVLRVDSLPDALRALGDLGLNTLLLEGGPTLATAFFAAGLVDEVRALVAPKVLGAGLPPLALAPRPMAQAHELRGVQIEVLGPDLLVSGLIRPVPRLAAAGGH
ncbi:bifunctional diaminohydroxyphosphoribosylaminopyrimidine deaminase/5-amino-6-(5-phosphoribosylamino)uracil reductase RibD [Deinococcus petrolearius]|uniref:Riboflavin biosynthesis protein RibD n=1 Tax=Deinococcus petrolearius TaxID=1751295 RepID=A0ABW1DG38_9DEIO